MSIYPTIVNHGGLLGGPTVSATLPFTRSLTYNVLSTEFENGIEQRRLLNSNPKRNIKLTYSPIYFEDAAVMKQFYMDRSGSFEEFSFFYPQYEVHVKEYCGIANQDDNWIRLPSNKADSFTLYQNGIPLTLDVNYYFYSEAGPDKEDLAELNFLSNEGDIYHWSFSGYLRVIARFSDNPFQSDDLQRLLSNINVELDSLQADGLYSET